MTPSAGPSFDLPTLGSGYAAGSFTPRDIVRLVRQRIDARGDGAIWISTFSDTALDQAARALEARQRAGERLPLFGVPFAVKDNIDVAGLPTTAACPAFAYTPAVSAPAVSRLIAAGAIAVGKTNMDQFATGLVGVRSPYGVPRNPFDADHVPGGSSSGSAVAVATGQVAFALGTDTAGSGRVPAAFNNIVGLKPSRGVISAAGVVPACRSLDCLSVFAATCEDAAAVAQVMGGFDATDPFSRPEADTVRFLGGPAASTFRFGIPAPGDRDFLGDDHAAAAFERAIAACERLGGQPEVIDMAPFREAGALLYAGPFVAERLEAAGRLFAERPEALVAPLREILGGAAARSARDVFTAQARLSSLRRQIAPVWNSVDFILFPTAPTFPRVDAVERDPLGVNAALGMYTTFANLLDVAAIAVPCGFRDDGLPTGATLFGPWGADGVLAAFGARLHRATSKSIGATGWPLPPAAVTTAPFTVTVNDNDTAGAAAVTVAVVGAHLTGQPLNHQLTNLGATLVAERRTKPCYRLFALRDTTPPKPGLVRTAAGDGVAVAVELWRLTPSAFGTFVSRIPPPLCMGKLELDDGTTVSGFLCEGHAIEGARDISSFGGWRAYLISVA
ncbi:MAG: allophanate hydrolase [Verrucomicrobiota bacterium]